MNRFSCKATFSILLSIFIAASCCAQYEKAEADIRSIMKKLDVVGLSVAVVKHNDLVYTHSFGMKNTNGAKRDLHRQTF